MQPEYRRIPIALIDVPADRLRSVKPDRIATLRQDIAALGLLQPIIVVEEESGRFTLTDGEHRLVACDLIGWNDIDARVTPAAWLKEQERRLQEIMANVDREQLTMLERAENLAEMKRVYEEMHPEAKHGGDRKSAKRKNQSEIFSFRSEAAEKTGLSRRAIEIAVAIVTRLDPEVKTRLRGTWLEDHQAGLRQLADQTPELQHKVCDLLFSTPPEAASVADAIVLAEGGRLRTSQEKLFESTSNNVSRLSERDFRQLVTLHRERIARIAKEEGWL